MALRNVTITLEEDVAQWARVAAARRDISLARFVGELLRETMERGVAYDAAMQRFLSTSPRALKGRDASYPTRDELHDRRALR